MKKRADKGKNEAKVSALSGAIKDLEVEIKKLGRERGALKQSLGETGSAIEVDREKEKQLQEKIAKLIEREAGLNQKRKIIQSKVDKVSDKLNKITKIKSEMSDI